MNALDDDHLNLLVCDVSGHGIGSALVANRIYTETMTQFRAGAKLDTMLRELNHFVMHNIGSSVFFFTVAAALMDRAARRMIFAGAGHPPGMVARAGEEPRLLESRSMVWGRFRMRWTRRPVWTWYRSGRPYGALHRRDYRRFQCAG